MGPAAAEHHALAGSGALTLVAATLSTVVGIAVAVYLSQLSPHRRTVLSFVIALPLTFSGLIVAYGFILGYGRAGFVTQLLARAGFDAATIGGALFTPTGLAFASSYYLIPRVVIGMHHPVAGKACDGVEVRHTAPTADDRIAIQLVLLVEA